MKKLIAILFLTIYSAFSFACSTFLLSRNGRHVFGRNYDWVTGSGMVTVNSRGVKKTSFSPAGEKTVSWVSAYGSITFNQFGKEFPHGGMNEKGLVVELMWLQDAKYPGPDDRAALNELQWIQYQMDNCATVEQVIATDKAIRISREGATPLHYLVADANGHAATIEFIKGKMVVHSGNDLPYPVLTNTVYKDAFESVKNNRGNRVSSGDNSVDRFATACRMVRQFQKANSNENPVEYAFTILGSIAQGDFTKWSIVYDITGRQIHFTTNDQRQRKSISFTFFDFSCKAVPLAFSLGSGTSGNISNRFSPLSFEQNKAILEQSAQESRSQVEIPAAALKGAADYFRQVACER